MWLDVNISSVVGKLTEGLVVVVVVVVVKEEYSMLLTI
jgi:hypothetical protein